MTAVPTGAPASPFDDRRAMAQPHVNLLEHLLGVHVEHPEVIPFEEKREISLIVLAERQVGHGGADSSPPTSSSNSCSQSVHLYS